MAGAKKRQAAHSAMIIFPLTSLPREVSRMWTFVELSNFWKGSDYVK